MKLIPALPLAAAALCGAAHAVDVYKWTDSQGVVHYGDHPASGVAASLVSVPGGGVSPEEEAAAQARLEAERAKLAEPAASASRRARPRAQPVQQPASAATCAAAWAQYAAAQACFDAHRVAEGKGVSEVGTAVCHDVPQPSCSR
jgi:hypothetical protein